MTITGYGRDTWCGDRLITGRMARGPVAVALSLYRRFRTPRGTLRGGDEAQAYGLDLAGFVGAVGYESALGALPGMVRAEALKDDRITDVDVAATIARNANGEIHIELVIVATLSDESSTFTQTLGVTGVTLDLLGIVTS
jgi:hypothetical protein